jgi:L-2-amino-thiazoline-4-carboxylic acid hydrolase-like protein
MPQMIPLRTASGGSMYTRGKRLSRFAAFAGGVAAGAALGRRTRTPRRMPHLRTFRAGLVRTHGAVEGAILAARVQARYDMLYATRPRFRHPALWWHLTSQILPGLALYETLKEDAAQRGAAYVTALNETGKLLERLDVLGPRLPLLRYVPFAFGLFRQFTRLTLLLYPATGYDIQIVEDTPTKLAFNMRRCFYLDVLTAYRAPELTAQYCHLDDVAFGALPPRITWDRTTTLGCGGDCCDFGWSAVTKRQQRENLDAGIVETGTAQPLGRWPQ